MKRQGHKTGINFLLAGKREKKNNKEKLSEDKKLFL